MEEKDIAFFISGDEEKLLADAKREFEKNVKFFIQINDVAFQKVWFLLAYSPTGAKKFYTLLYIANYVLNNDTYKVNDRELLLNAKNFANERVAPKITALKKLLKKYEKVITETRTEQVVEERPRKAEKLLPHKYAESLKAKLLAEYNDDEPMKQYINASIHKRGGAGTSVEHNIQNLLAGFFNKICKIRITYDKQNNQISAVLVGKRLNKYSKSIVPLVRLDKKESDVIITVDDSVVDAEVDSVVEAKDNLKLGFDLDFIKGNKNTINLDTFYKYTGYFVAAPFGVAGFASAVPFIGAYLLGQTVNKNVIKPNLKKTLLMKNLVYKPSIKNCMRLLIPVVINEYKLEKDTVSSDRPLRFDIQPPVSAIKTLAKEYRKSKIVSTIQKIKEGQSSDIKPSLKNFLTILKPINKTQKEVMLHSNYSIDRRVDELLTQPAPTLRDVNNHLGVIQGDPKIYTATTTLNHKPVILKGGGKKGYTNIIEIDEKISDTPIPKEKIVYCSDAARKAYVSKLLDNNTLPYSKTKEVFVKWDIPADSTVLVIGDIHGDYNALESVLDRWIDKKYLIKETSSTDKNPVYLLGNKVFVISTGDLIDYGKHSLNVLCAMLRLREDNKDKVMLLCGNHETNINPLEKISGKDDFDNEIKAFMTSSGNLSNRDRIIEIFSKQISLIGPDMLALHFGGELEGTYFMHGMYPFAEIDGTYYDYYDTKNTDTVTTFLNVHAIGGTQKASSVSDLIQRNDLSGVPESEPTNRGIKGVVQVGSDHLIDVMNKYRIKGFIRGHQDNCGAQNYPYDVHCENTINIKYAKTKDDKNYSKMCRQTSTSDSVWCSSKQIEYAYQKLSESESKSKSKSNQINARIITLSMAHEKHADKQYSPPMGGYIKLTATSSSFSA